VRRAPEEHASVEFLEWLPSPVRRAVRRTRRGPDEILRAYPRSADRLAQMVQPLLGKHHRGPAPQRDLFDVAIGQTIDKQVAVLPFAGALTGAVLQPCAHDLLAQILGRPVLPDAFRRRLPTRGKQTDDRLTA
jgi:hypothetical protein